METGSSLKLQVEKIESNGKKVVIADEFQSPNEKPLSADDIPLIDQTIMRLSDTSGKSPDKRIALAERRSSNEATASGADKYVTPKKNARANLRDKFEVMK